MFPLSLLYDGAPAYSDNSEFQLHAVPEQLRGLRYIRSPQTPAMSLMDFRVNLPATLYVGHPNEQPFPVAPFEEYQWKAQDTQYLLSVHEKEAGGEGPKQELQFSFKRVVHRGGSFSLSISHTGVPFIVVFSPVEVSANACGKQLPVSVLH